MTAKAGRHRTIRLPEELIQAIDAVRGTTAREAWVRAQLHLAVDTCRTHEPAYARAAGQVIRQQEAESLPPTPYEEDEPTLPPPTAAHHATGAVVAGRLGAEQAVREVKPRLRLKRPGAKS